MELELFFILEVELIFVVPIVVFGAAAINTNTSSGFAFPAEESSAFGDEKIEIPQSVFNSSSGQCDEVFILDLMTMTRQVQRCGLQNVKKQCEFKHLKKPR